VFENCVLRRIFGPKRDGVMGDWTKLHNEELRDLCFSLCLIGIIRSRRMRLAGLAAQIWDRALIYVISWKTKRESH
jgi:hypothetical protein